MKKIILFFLLTSILSCNKKNQLENNDLEVINLNIKNKDLNYFFNGNDYYKVKGLSFKDSTSTYKFKLKNALLELKVKNKFIYGFKDGIIIQDSISFNLHDMGLIKSKPVKINFNDYKSKEAHFFPNLSRENLELLKNRSTKIYTIGENLNLEPVYLSDEYKNESKININDIKFHNTTKSNIKTLNSLIFYPVDLNSFFVVHNPLTGLYTLLPNFKRFTKKKNNIIDIISKKIIYDRSKVNSQKKDTIYVKTSLNLKKSLTFNNKVIQIKEGVNINLLNNSNLFFENSKVYFQGSNSKKIKIKGYYKNSIYFSNCQVNINNSNFDGLSNLKNNELSLPSSITFYNSIIHISNSNFKNNIEGDDYLNFYNSKFSIDSVGIYNSNSDAIDSDFSTGEISNVRMENIGNDALDFSGSHVNIENSQFHNVFDKAISAGEASNIFVENCYLEGNELAIVVKDGSRLFSANNKLINNRIDYAVFFKKDFYEAPSLILDTIDSSALNLFQKGVKLKLKDNFNVKFLKEVEPLLYGNLYGKSSK